MLKKFCALCFLILLFNQITISQVTIRARIILEQSDTNEVINKNFVIRLAKSGESFSGFVSPFTGNVELVFAYARETYGTLDINSKIIVETKDTLFEHSVFPEFDYRWGQDNASFCYFCWGDDRDPCGRLNRKSIPYYQYEKILMGSVKPQFATVSFKVTAGDSVKIFYETTPPQVGLIERIPLEYSQRGNYYDGYTNETISYTYLNFAKYYECLRWYGTVLDVYAFEYPVEDIEIMLGETKYFQVKEEDDKLKIEEVSTPTLSGGIAEDIWGDNPVEIVEGDKMGIYWEKEKPIPDESSNLPKGIIRVIGRYWSVNKTYKIKLKAKHGDKNAESIINVVKPSRLLKEGQSPAYDKYVDVNNNVVNADSLFITLGGKYGIPPQFLKGHVFQEAAKKNFGGEIGWAFTPSFRYEPYTTQWNKYLKSWSGRFYFKDISNADYSDIPNHQNVLFMDYIKEAKTVWEIIEGYSQLVNPNNSSDYGKRNADHTMNFYPTRFKGLQDKYDEYLNLYENDRKLKRPESADSANWAMVKWFKEEWKSGEAKTTVAQTRAASSYGSFQMLYTTARDEVKYDKNKLPEELNENYAFEIFVKRQKDLLIEKLGSQTEKSNNWSTGYESVLKSAIFVPWNKSKTYPDEVIKNSKKFLPQR